MLKFIRNKEIKMGTMDADDYVQPKKTPKAFADILSDYKLIDI